jgi:hypothetical protein
VSARVGNVKNIGRRNAEYTETEYFPYIQFHLLDEAEIREFCECRA